MNNKIMEIELFNYETRDYLIPIHCSDGKTLYFSKNILIQCDVVKMLLKYDQGKELNMPFDSRMMTEFLMFFETRNLINIQNFCTIANYLQLNDYFGESTIDFIIADLDENHGYYGFHFFYHYIVLHSKSPDNLNKETIDQLFLEIKPINHKYRTKIRNWLDLINIFKAPSLLKEMYIDLMKRYYELRLTKDYYDDEFYIKYVFKYERW